MRGPVFAVLIACVFAIATTSSRSDTLPSPTVTEPEPLGGEPLVPNPGDDIVVQRFQPYEIGPTEEAAWRYESLSTAEKAVVDAGRNVAHWNKVHDGYKQAVLLRAAEAHAHGAATQIGLETLATGVVP